MSKKTIFRELNNVQNPALGAALIWRFSVGYKVSSRTSEYPAMQLAFLVLPMSFHQETYELLTSTRQNSGIHQFADKFSQKDNLKGDILLSLHSRATTMRSLTLDSLRIGRTRLITVEPDTGRIVPLSESKPSGLPPSIKKMIDNAEKLGGWLSDLSLFEVSSTLKVGF
ncbi:MAG: DUF6521 family protein [Paludisphaera borealis]|uniref:three component ABC system middle component n=1 Tax=Paludisphaera borealis TaxID=1387353 RepID=UPI0028451065|nr:three component ABC system middle component [Paludisphaera borealis]MDR3618100.1 DUF6521 family protein [Paludisphaera borealis]